MNKNVFRLISFCQDVKTLERSDCSSYRFDNLSDLLKFYRFLLNNGYVYEFQFQRFIKYGYLINIIYSV